MMVASDHDLVFIRRIIAARNLRRSESLNLYRPQIWAEPFHSSNAPERIVRGGNRAGKTMAAAVEVARALTGQDPYNKYPKENGICYCVAKSGRELAQKMWALLGRPGAFRMIRDKDTQEWVSFDPENPDHAARYKQAKRTPPLIPKRMIQKIAWMEKKSDWPKVVHLTNGWQVHFYSSEGKPTQGTDIDLSWFDEEVTDPSWYPEMAARLVDRRGKFIWSATPQAGTERLFALHERAEKEEEAGGPRLIEEFFCTIDNNKYIPEADRNLFRAKFLEDEQESRVRIYGEFAILSGRVYPEYSPKLHEVDPFTVPETWTRYVAIDPGRQVCAVLFGACPPPDMGDQFYLYDELYLKNCSAALFGQAMSKKSYAQTFYVFIIDRHEAFKHDTGHGRTVQQQYSEQLKEHGVESLTTGHSFALGDDNIRAGIERVKHWLRWRQDGTSKIKVFRTLTNFVKEIKHYRNKQIKGEFVDEPERRNNHLMDTLRYLVQYNPVWQPPRNKAPRPSGVYAAWMKQQEKEHKNGGGILLGPGRY